VHNAEQRLANNPVFHDYYLFIPNRNKRSNNRTTGYNSNVILSKYPIIDTQEVVFPKQNNKEHVENCSRADIKIDNQVIRVYSAHFPIYKTGAATRLRLLEFLLKDASTHPGPVIICGDLNTASPKTGLKRTIIHTWHRPRQQDLYIAGTKLLGDERDLFAQSVRTHGFTEVLDIHTPTWSPFKSQYLELFNLKLDWFIVKNMEVERYNLGTYVSDHKSVRVQCKLP
jgi:endonuclease/exonuclease/phosphatase family metal-dependent hydrolase